ncbi:heterokaryon incompatibility protein-domain-containing protein, partial [Lophiotrema nucula]
MASQDPRLSRSSKAANSSLVTPKLDFFCQDIPVLRNIFHQRESVKYNAIQKSARDGCFLCKVICSATDRLVAEHPSHTLQHDKVYFDGLNRSSGLLVGLESPEEPWFFQIQLYILEDNQPGQVPRSVPRIYTGSEAAILQARKWLFTCLQLHSSLCSTMAEVNPRLPTRLLEIDRQSESPVKLCESKYYDNKYACLSHCWGGHQPLKTTSLNRARHREGILWEHLPKTFQDAIGVVRDLGYSYIWVDSLCIIQDDEDDWNREAARMADIYRNSVVTISAAAGAGPYAGLFAQGAGELGTVEIDNPRLQQNQMPQIYARSVLDHQRTEHPLCNRAWVLQERLLSPRVIHFGNNELLWECMEERCCSCGPRQYWPGWLEEKKEFHPNALAALDAHGISNAWRRVVSNYTSMKLTMEKDILPALAGAAKVMAQVLKTKGFETTYLAGLWEFRFVEDCAWSSRASSAERRPTGYRAP